MKYTSSEAAKLLRRLEDELSGFESMESMSKEFLAAVGEDTESVRPVYDYEDTQKKIDETEQKIRKVKHAINVFNTTHTVPGFDMTIDQLLIYMPQLTKRRFKLENMKNKLPKTREQAPYGKTLNIIDYRYVNYDIEKASEDYDKTADLLARAQTALDLINSTETMEIDL